MIVHQMDITAFLNGELQEEIYMQQPPGYEVPDGDKLVCRLKKSLYGLKQASRCWNKSFQNFMLDLGHRQCHADSCIFINEESECRTIVAVYVDDLIVMSSVLEKLTILKKNLSIRFIMKDMGSLHYCLDVNIIQNVDGIWLHLKQYVLSLL